ncbi:DNA cytosine methyltransferase [Candidatus Woesearchaeota archaeon]|jgi:DNA (cytosine-5)-methyltransferase 1|nr:DNA cytosine methyltransferase [Candidatus Woesearchaeota archaeon]MBT4368257.1 DNA cytosine methyltransferase [Candidatus Woesearchaeota archaeon]MBT4712746.1 DNA cytosine methyltransferase [Candidatus Woesearchaeota archaeon]MBT6639658.1 DNA cytosine methyltransferase [Candidatus Woesearchaeota archaeon]MBT7133830.1 DNA cytosine methyltransferase [Candidatus Woesearchaeota archaeon]
MKKCRACDKELEKNEFDFCSTCLKFHDKNYNKQKKKELYNKYEEIHKPKVIDLFAGCGGLSYGFHSAGFNVVGFIEKCKTAIDTFKKNFPNAIHIGTDIKQVKNSELLKYKNKIDIITGGPPCQGFSFCGKRNPKDKRNQLYKEFIRIISIINPKIVVIENVPGIKSMKDLDKRSILDKILKELISLDYSVSHKLLVASDFQVPQNRKRLIIIAKKNEFFPEPSKNKVTVIEAIKDLPKEGSDLNGHVLFQTTQKVIEKIKNTKQGGKLSDKYNFCRQRLYANKPSKTITTEPIFIHPVHDRFLTPRELARLQSFPDSFVFMGTKTSILKQIGNAVPPKLAFAIAQKIREVLENDN